MMKKILSLILMAIIIAHVFLSVTPGEKQKPELTLSMLKAMADGGDGENEPPFPPIYPIPDGGIPDSIMVIIYPEW